MKINKLKINSFGKLKNLEINLNEKINIIYGKNESGKSTLLKFIINSFYGISKNKKGKEFSDFEKYNPWEQDEFSGKLEYELDNKKRYEIFRDFKKKNPKIFDENMQDISKEFNIDKNKGNEFFYEQTKIDEELFLSTVVVNQQEVKLEKQEQNMLIQKIANLVGTGDDNVSFKKAIDRINRRQLDEVGTERSREKPINITSKEIQNLELEKQNLEKYINIKYDIDENKNNLILEIKKLENEKIKIKENIKNNNLEKINLLKNKIDEIKNNNKNLLKENNLNNNLNIKSEKNKLNKKIILFSILIIIINILQLIFIKNIILNSIFLLTVPMLIIFSVYFKNKLNKKIKNQEKNNLNNLEKINLEINKLKNEINILEKNNEELENEINKLKNNFNLKINLEKEKIKNNYSNVIEENKIIKLINIENVNYEIDNYQNKINNLKIELHTLDLDKKNIEPKLENLSRIEESLVNNKEIMCTLKKLDKSMNLAKTILNEAYEKMKTSVTPRFTQNLSDNISKITNGKYSKVMLNEENGVVVELQNGNYETVSKLSVGTIEQLYLALRLSMVEDLSEEKMPIILDEAFAYYDKDRLENILKYLEDRFKNNQIIIFTCTNREKEILEKLNIEFNFIEI